MAQNPNPSHLDPGQIVKRVYDEANDRIRVDAAITAPDGTSILIDATTDSIKVGNTALGPFLNVTSDGSINSNLNALATFQTAQYSVGLTAVQLDSSPLTNRSSISVKVSTTASNAVIYLGNSSSVTTSTGYPLFNGDSIQLDLKPTQPVYAISNVVGQSVYVLETG